MSLRAKRSKPHKHQYAVYIATNFHNTVLYTGVTNSLVRRMHEHKNHIGSAFTKRYNIDKLVYYELYKDVLEAIAREKQIKGGSRQRKINLIKSMNSMFDDLYEQII